MPQRPTAQAAQTQYRRTQQDPQPGTAQPAQLWLTKPQQVLLGLLLVLLRQMAAAA
jgi:hypothetical protein